MPPIDHTPTSVIPRVPSDTGQFAALRPAASPLAACPVIPHPAAWRHAFAAALVLAWLTLATGAYILARVWILLAGWH